MTKFLEIPALRIEQSPGRFLHAFGIDGKVLGRIAAVSRVRRDQRNRLSGYQRPEVVAHIAEIRRYIESERPMIPNALVVAFDQRVAFVPDDASPRPGESCFGMLRVPVPEGDDEADKPGWVVDGQQRLSAIRDAAVDRFPMIAVGFIAKDDHEQREQFILVNSTKPLPKGLIYELLPSTGARLSSKLQRRRFPARLLEELNHREDSSLRSLIHTPTSPDGVIKDNSILRMLENSLSDGALGRLEASSQQATIDAMAGMVSLFWDAVRRVWPEAWAQPPRKSRLMHGVGVVGLGFVMDAIVDHRAPDDPRALSRWFETDLRAIAPVCRWTSGAWRFGPGATRKWNELQNTSGDIQLVADHLLRTYRESLKASRKGGRVTPGRATARSRA
jgi:DGQHR domain-containing protein